MPGCARREIVDESAVGVDHCALRRVRCAFLRGEDPVSGRNFDHRKAWLGRAAGDARRCVCHRRARLRRDVEPHVLVVYASLVRADRATREDRVTGRFWEGRFECQALLDVFEQRRLLSFSRLQPACAGLQPPSAADIAKVESGKRLEA